MKEQLVSKEIAILAKEKGFDWKCMWFYDLDLTNRNLFTYRSVENYNDNIIFESKNFVSAPTQSLVQKWLRDIHNIHIEIWYNNEMKGWEKTLFALDLKDRKIIHIDDIVRFNTYEETLEHGLQKALKLI